MSGSARTPATTWLNPKIKMGDSPIEGRGLFAAEAIAEGETIAVIGGRILSDAEFRTFAAASPKYSAVQIDEDRHVVIEDDHPATHGNHSCDANTWMLDAVTTAARRPIATGEEITVEYATHTASPDWSMRCACGTRLCRGLIGGDDWRRPDVQRRYAGHFSPFLNRRIEQVAGSRLPDDAHLPLHGLRVLDLTMVWAGPSGTRLLADMGAEVIKVESARSWDMLRSLHFLSGPPEQWWDKAAYFNHNNRNKFGCTIDLQTDRGRELALRLAALADVVVENYRADVIGKLRLDYDDLRAVNPDIILVSMPSHGKTGPESHHVAYGTNVEQLAGLASLSGYPGMGPHKSPIAFGDPNAGAIAAASALAALRHRDRTGEGQHVEVAQWEALIGNIGEFILAWQMNRVEHESLGNRHASRVQGVYQCATPDEWVAISVGSDAEFAALCPVIRRVEMINDSRFADVVSRRRHHDAFDAMVGEWTSTQSQDEAARALQAAGVSAAPVLKIPSLMANEHLRTRGFWETVSHAAAGSWDIEGPVWRMSRTPAHVRTAAPMFGEHNAYVFGKLLGLSDTEIAQLDADGVTAHEPSAGLHS